MPMEKDQPAETFAPVILAGGSGTRFWPRSRRNRAKQVLALSGQETMIQQTIERLLPLAQADSFLIITNDLLAGTIADQLPAVPDRMILREPAARNTAPACALAAMIVERTDPGTVLGVFPSDHVVGDVSRFLEIIRAGISVAAAGENIVVLGAPPTRPETGYGYIQHGAPAPQFVQDGVAAHTVACFTEKPDLARAEQFLASGKYAWNSGIFLWSARTLANAIREHCPQMVPHLERIAASFGTPQFESTFAKCYPLVDSISIDYAVLEPRSARGAAASNIFCLPADFGWSDLGSWSALHEHFLERTSDSADGNVVHAGGSLPLDSTGNYVFAPGLTVALLGVHDLVVVQTDDALLVTTRAHSQEVGRVVKELVNASRHDLV